MIDNPGIVNLPPDPEALAFVLRVRTDASRQRNRTVVDLEDVKARQSWHFNSLEAAFTQIRSALDLHVGSHGQSDKPH